MTLHGIPACRWAGLMALTLVCACARPPTAAEAASIPPTTETTIKDDGKPPTGPCPAVTVDLEVGEKLIYQVTAGWFDAGILEMTVEALEMKDGAKAYRINRRTHAKGLVKSVYNLEANATTWLDARGGFSRGYESDDLAGSRRAVDKIKYDYAAGKARVDREIIKPHRRDVFHQEFSVPARAQDRLSLLYYLRKIDLQKNPPAFTLVTGSRTYPIQVRYMGREKLVLTVNGRKRTINAIKVIPYSDKPGAFSKTGQMTVWVDPDTKIPLKVLSETKMADVTAMLHSTKNSKLR